MHFTSPRWQPTQIRQVLRVLDTSTTPATVKTDAGLGYAKAPGNREGPRALACEWLGTRLAGWLGLPTLDLAQIAIGPSVCWALDPMTPDGSTVGPGVGIVSRAVPGTAWDGSADAFQGSVENPEVAVGLVVVDTWLRNADRCSPDGTRTNHRNVFLSEEEASPGKHRLMAIDFTAAFTAGKTLNKSCRSIDAVKDEGVYGLFDAFLPLVEKDAVDSYRVTLGTLTRPTVSDIVSEFPHDWEVDHELGEALVDLVVNRAQFLSDNLTDLVMGRWNLSAGG